MIWPEVIYHAIDVFGIIVIPIFMVCFIVWNITKDNKD
jgi:cbb3-type cytochrome oxidase subunit 3